MKIANAALQMNVLESALSYRVLGMSVVPVVGKRAAIPWKLYQTQKPTFATIRGWDNRGLLRGVAVVCGAVSGNLVVLDLDGMEAVTDFRHTFPELSQTYTVRTGSGQGEHFYFYAKTLPPTTVSPGYELRANGTYVVAPPSIHPKTGKAYRVQNASAPRCLDDLHELAEWVASKRPPPSLPTVPSSSPPPVPTQPARAPLSPAPKTKRLHAYGKAGVARELARLRSTRTEVNNQLYHTSLILARLVANPDFGLSEIDVKGQIADAASHLSQRDGFKATYLTIESGWAAGAVNPRPTPELS